MIIPQIPLHWSEPKRVNTKMGPRELLTAVPTDEFWQVWRREKTALKAAGYAVAKDNAGIWVVNLWREPTLSQTEKTNLKASRATDADFDVPRPEGLDLFPFQRAGVAFAKDKDSILIADEMGLGKTVQGLSLINVWKARTALIIVPASLRLNWAREARKWLLDSPRIDVISTDTWPENPEIVIINYDRLKKFHAEIRATRWDVLIADECHYLKNDKAHRTKEVFGGKDVPKIPAKRRVMLSGTPILNRPIEIHSILKYLDPKAWSNKHKFALRYCDAKHNGWGWDYTGASNLDELQEQLRATVMVRRLKKDVLTELPPKVRQVIEIDPDAKMARLAKKENERAAHFDAERARLKAAALLAEAAGNEAAYREAVAKLQSVEAAAFTELSKIRHELAVSKVPAVVEHLQNVSDKVIVMAHHKDVIAQIVEGLGPENCVTLVGDTKMEDRQIAVDRFQNDESVRYFIGSIKAAGVGITLTRSSHVVFAEMDWTPGMMDQAEDRAHRIGQTESVLVQFLVVDGSLDARMAQTNVNKKRVIESALDVQHERPEADPVSLDLDWDATIAAIKAEQEAKAKAEQNKIVDRKIGNAKAKAGLFEDVAVSEDVRAAAHEGVRILAVLDPDRAKEQNESGYNAVDGHVGHGLALIERLSNREVALARVVLRKYKRQLGDLYGRIFPEER